MAVLHLACKRNLLGVFQPVPSSPGVTSGNRVSLHDLDTYSRDLVAPDGITNSIRRLLLAYNKRDVTAIEPVACTDVSLGLVTYAGCATEEALLRSAVVMIFVQIYLDYTLLSLSIPTYCGIFHGVSPVLV